MTKAMIAVDQNHHDCDVSLMRRSTQRKFKFTGRADTRHFSSSSSLSLRRRNRHPCHLSLSSCSSRWWFSHLLVSSSTSSSSLVSHKYHCHPNIIIPYGNPIGLMMMTTMMMMVMMMMMMMMAIMMMMMMMTSGSGNAVTATLFVNSAGKSHRFNFHVH